MSHDCVTTPRSHRMKTIRAVKTFRTRSHAICEGIALRFLGSPWAPQGGAREFFTHADFLVTVNAADDAGFSATRDP